MGRIDGRVHVFGISALIKEISGKCLALVPHEDRPDTFYTERVPRTPLVCRRLQFVLHDLYENSMSAVCNLHILYCRHSNLIGLLEAFRLLEDISGSGNISVNASRITIIVRLL